MKRAILIPVLAFFSVVFFVSCMKTVDPCTSNTLAQDRHIIDSFLNVTPSLGSVSFNSTHNVYLGIDNPGSGSAPVADSQIVFKVEQRLLNGNLIDSGTVRTTQQGFPYKLNDFDPQSLDYLIFSQLRKGGSMKVIIPSSLNGLGCNSGTGRYGNIPGNSQLINTITLVDVKRNQ